MNPNYQREVILLLQHLDIAVNIIDINVENI